MILPSKIAAEAIRRCILTARRSEIFMPAARKILTACAICGRILLKSTSQHLRQIINIFDIARRAKNPFSPNPNRLRANFRATDRRSVRQTILTRNRSANAARDSSVGSAFDAPTQTRSGTFIRVCPRRKMRSFKIPKSVFKIAVEPRKYLVEKSNFSFGQHSRNFGFDHAFLNFRKSTGPKISLGSVNRPRRYSKYSPPVALAIRRTASLLAVPGAPIIKTCSCAIAASATNSTRVSRSIRFLLASADCKANRFDRCFKIF